MDSEDWVGFGDPENNQGNSRRNLYFLIAVFVSLVIIGFLAFRIGDLELIRFGELRFSIIYPDSQGLTEGSPVYYKGIRVGEVAQVEFSGNGSVEVIVGIDSDYEEVLFQESTFFITENTSPYPEDQMYTQMILVEYWGKEQAPIENGMVFEGPESQMDYYLQIVQLVGAREMDRVAKVGDLFVDTLVLNDATIEQTLILNSGKWIPQELMFKGLLPNSAGWEQTVLESENFNQLTSTGSFNNTSAAEWGNSELSIQIENKFFWTEYTFQQRFDPEDFQVVITSEQDLETDDYVSLGVELLACIAESAACLFSIDDALEVIIPLIGNQLSNLSSLPLGNVQVSVDLHLPGRIIETNAPISSGSQASWTLTGEEMNEGYVFFAVSRQINPVPLIVIALLLVAIVVFIVLRWRNRTVEKSVFSDTGQM